MRRLLLSAAVLMLAGCNPSATGTTASETTAATAALPENFPNADPTVRAAECAAYLGLSIAAHATPAGRDQPIMQQSADQWRAWLSVEDKMSDDEVNQLVASSVNPLSPTPSATRDAASAWCVENAPEPDPQH